MAAAPKDADVRSVIRSILVSNPNEMTLQFLDRDFKEMEGYPIPYQKFGFKSLLDYVKSIPDTVTVKGSFSNPVVLPVATEKAAHVEKLVLKQRLATNRRMPARRTRNHELGENQTQSTANNSLQNSAKKKKNNLYLIKKRQQAALRRLSNMMDDSSSFSLTVATRLRRLSQHQRHFAEILINRVLYHGASGLLSSATDLTNCYYYDQQFTSYYNSYY